MGSGSPVPDAASSSDLLASIVLCTFQRPEALRTCLRALSRQTEKRYELILRTEEGPLAAVRNRGLRSAHGAVVCFLDDDTVAPPGWLAGVLDVFNRHPTAVGVTGPAIVPPAYRQNRDLLRYNWLWQLYKLVFVEGKWPCHVSRSGAISITTDANQGYDGEVQFLEACNMSYRTAALKAIGGVDEAYTALWEWSEPDACYRLQGMLWYSPRATLVHQPAGGAATQRRYAGASRLRNYRLFLTRWVAPSWRRSLYEAFLVGYYCGWLPFQAWRTHGNTRVL